LGLAGGLILARGLDPWPWCLPFCADCCSPSWDEWHTAEATGTRDALHGELGEAAKTEAYLAAMQRRLSELQAELGSYQVAD
jgi:hypothetical protein